MKVVDNRGLPCPQPVINTKRALDALPAGAAGLVSLVDNTVARENVMKFARSQGYLAEAIEEAGVYRVTINRGETAGTRALLPVSAPDAEANSRRTLYLVAADEIGQGESALGLALMKTFLFSLAEKGDRGNCLTFVNTGVRLSCEGSAVLPSLQKLCELGWEIKSCGTCLDYYGLKEKLLIGEVTNMYSIVEDMAVCGKVVSL